MADWENVSECVRAYCILLLLLLFHCAVVVVVVCRNWVNIISKWIWIITLHSTEFESVMMTWPDDHKWPHVAVWVRVQPDPRYGCAKWVWLCVHPASSDSSVYILYKMCRLRFHIKIRVSMDWEMVIFGLLKSIVKKFTNPEYSGSKKFFFHFLEMHGKTIV